VVKGLERAGIPADAIHGNKSQNHRERVLAAFPLGRDPHLVATDIAARGIDVDGISHVVNFDLPNIPETYVHRIGRTARAGADGVAISLCAGEEMAYLRDIEKLIRITLPREDRRTPGHRDTAPAPSRNRGSRSRASMHVGKDQRRGTGIEGSSPPSSGGGGGSPQPTRHETNRHEPSRPAQTAKAEGMQGVAFFASRKPAEYQPNRTHRPR
jgi:superfamily II DNA/RNA helicase